MCTKLTCDDVRYCTRMSMLLKSRQHAGKAIYHWTSSGPRDAAARTNAAYLISAYAVIILGMSPEDAFAPIAPLEHSFVGYRDASYNHACAYGSIPSPPMTTATKTYCAVAGD